MVYSFSLISFIIIANHFLIPISNAIPSVEDNMLIAVMTGHQETQISEYSIQKYEANIGILYYMRKNWHCDQITDEFDEYERTECQKYRKYLDILYEYLHRKYAQIPKVKPKFVFKKEIEIEGPIIYAVNCLTRISQFYFHFNWSNGYEYKLNKLFEYDYEPKLLNEERLNYEFKLKNEPKLPISEMILQLAIDTANETQTNENLDGIIRQNFDKNMKQMFTKVIFEPQFNDRLTWTKDALFWEFVKGLAATNSEKFSKMAKEYSNYLSQLKKKENIYWDDEEMISFGLDENEKMKEHLTQKYKAILGLLYLMRKKWQCAKIGKEFEEKCKIYQKYLDILYEYLFQLYVQGKSADLANKFSAVKPIYMSYYEYHKNRKDLISVVQILNEFSIFFWQKDENILMDIDDLLVLVLLNETDLNYEIKEEKYLLKKLTDQKICKKRKIILNLLNEIEDNLRQEFEQKMQKMYENTKQNAKEEEVKLDKAIANAANNEEKADLQNEYDNKFGTFNSSPFS